MRSLNKRNILVGLISSLIHIPQEFIRLESGGVDISLVLVPNLEEFIIKGGSLSFADDMIDILSLELLQRGGKRGFTARGKPKPGYPIIYRVSQIFAGHEGMI